VSVAIVDWLGRGGIAQCAESWAIELHDHGHDVWLATRAGRELDGAGLPLVSADGRGRLGAHRQVVRACVAAIRERRPSTVVIQNFLIPLLEEPVHRAARSVGAKVVVVIHDHRHHTRTSGNHVGLARQVQRADVVIAHSAYVAERLAAASGREPELLPLPLQLGTLRAPSPSAPVLPPPDAGRSRALHFGVLSRRSTKGTDLVVELAAGGVGGWELAFLGVDAPAVAGARSVDRFLTAGEMVDAVRSSSASLLPYRVATQSGAVVLAQALGSVPVGTRVGALAEQIDHGRTGLLVDPGTPAAGWRRLLEELDARDLATMAEQGAAAVERDHRAFARRALEIVAT
jgi:glycosyltransferase involved in cell wall biosynthesis